MSTRKRKVDWHERRIYWQNRVDEIVSKLAGWEPVEDWHGVPIGGLCNERKRAIAAAIEHLLEMRG